MMMQLRASVTPVVIYDPVPNVPKNDGNGSFREHRHGRKVISVTQPMIGKDLRDPTNFLTEGSMALFNQIWALQTRPEDHGRCASWPETASTPAASPPWAMWSKTAAWRSARKRPPLSAGSSGNTATGKSYREIIAGLNRDGLKTKGRGLRQQQSSDLLHNEKYIGVLTYGGAPYREDGTRNTHAAASANAIR